MGLLGLTTQRSSMWLLTRAPTHKSNAIIIRPPVVGPSETWDITVDEADDQKSDASSLQLIPIRKSHNHNFESVDVSKRRIDWLTQTAFLTGTRRDASRTPSGFPDPQNLKVVLYVAEDDAHRMGLCEEALELLDGVEYEMSRVYREEVQFLATRMGADIMLFGDKDIKLAIYGEDNGSE